MTFSPVTKIYCAKTKINFTYGYIYGTKENLAVVRTGNSLQTCQM